MKAIGLLALFCCTLYGCLTVDGLNGNSFSGQLMLDCNGTPIANTKLTLKCARGFMKNESDEVVTTTDENGNFKLVYPDCWIPREIVSDSGKTLMGFYSTYGLAEAVDLDKLFESPRQEVKVVMSFSASGDLQDTVVITSNNFLSNELIVEKTIVGPFPDTMTVSLFSEVQRLQFVDGTAQATFLKNFRGKLNHTQSISFGRRPTNTYSCDSVVSIFVDVEVQ